MNEKRRFFDEVSQGCGMDYFKDDEIPKLRNHISRKSPLDAPPLAVGRKAASGVAGSVV